MPPRPRLHHTACAAILTALLAACGTMKQMPMLQLMEAESQVPVVLLRVPSATAADSNNAFTLARNVTANPAQYGLSLKLEGLAVNIDRPSRQWQMRFKNNAYNDKTIVVTFRILSHDMLTYSEEKDDRLRLVPEQAFFSDGTGDGPHLDAYRDDILHDVLVLWRKVQDLSGGKLVLEQPQMPQTVPVS